MPAPELRGGHATMTTPSVQKMPMQRRAKIRKFYTISWSYFHGLADFEVENLQVLVGGPGALYPPGGRGPAARRGFPKYPENPRVVIGKRRKGPPPSDIELFHCYWLISDRLKLLFESVDPPAFAFQVCDVTLRDGSTGPVYWLCDVVRVLEAFDERTSQELRRSPNKFYSLKNARSLIFDETVIEELHIFRTPYSYTSGSVFCDQSMKDAFKAASIKGVRFVDCTPRRSTITRPPVGLVAKV